MSTCTAPIYTGTLNGIPLRLFKAPYTTPHLPWHSYDDLMRCVGVRQTSRNELLNFIRTDHPNDVRTVAYRSEILIITPHYAAMWFIKNLCATIKSREKHEIDYLNNIYKAWCASVRGVPCRDNIDLYFLAHENTHRAAGSGWVA